MKKIRNITFLAGVAVLAFGVLTKYVPGFTITDTAWGFCLGFSSVMIAVALGFAIAPVFCKKNKQEQSTFEGGE